MSNPGLERMIGNFISANSCTPNVNALYDDDVIPLFIYGTERYKFSYHHLLHGTPRFAIGRTVTPTFRMYKVCEKGLGWTYPVIQPMPGSPDTATVFGEVYLVSPDLVLELDQMYDLGAGGWTRVHGMVRYKPFKQEGGQNQFFASLCQYYQGYGDYWEGLTHTQEAEVIKPRTRIDDNQSVPRLCLSYTYSDDKPNQEEGEKPWNE